MNTTNIYRLPVTNWIAGRTAHVRTSMVRLWPIGFLKILAFFLFAPLSASATDSLVHDFDNASGDGMSPGGLIQGTDGDLYGLAAGGTSSRCILGCDVIFKVGTDGTGFTIVHDFHDIIPATSQLGADPVKLIQGADGYLYGITHSGGTHNLGTVYRVNTDGTGFELLHEFAGWDTDGQLPLDLIQGADGNLYGTVSAGTCNLGDCGTVFTLHTDGTYFGWVHAPFAGAGGLGGAYIVQGEDGNFYGVTKDGGSGPCDYGLGCGTVFRLTLGRLRILTTLYDFKDIYPFAAADADAQPGRLIQGADGALYGTTFYGGSPGIGTIFTLNTDGTGFTILHNFTSGSSDGNKGVDLIQGEDGALYGTTYYGGSANLGTVFTLNTDGTDFALLHAFAGYPATDGALTHNLLQGADGNLYGTTAYGGSHNTGHCNPSGEDLDGCGTVWRLASPDSTAPTTTAALSPASPNGTNGWYVTPVPVNLSATDPDDASNTLTTYVKVDGGSTQTANSVTLTGDGVHTVQYWSEDPAGNVEAPKSVSIKIDTQAPKVSCGSASGSWSATDVSIGCTASDGVSGLANPSQASFSLQTSVPAGTETANASTDSVNVCDAAGNCSTAGPISGNKVDKKAPSITITTPTATSYPLGQTVNAAYGCSDGGSGVATCAGTVANGAPIDTGSIGAKTFAVNGTDNVGNTSSSSVAYSVRYNLCFSYDTSKPANSGSTIPVKVSLCDANGHNLSSPSVTLTVVGVSPIPSRGNANPGGQFRYDATLGQGGGYIFNLNTTGYPAGNHTLNFAVSGDPVTVYQAPFVIR